MTGVTDSPALVWFRNDLRLSDNRALAAACNSDRPLILLYVLDDETPGPWRMGGASRWWLHKSLSALARDIESRGNRLILRRGNAALALIKLVRENRCAEVMFTRRYEPWAAEEEISLARDLEALGIRTRRFGGSLLFEPDAVRTGTGGPFKVFTPFYRAAMSALKPRQATPAPDRLSAPMAIPGSDTLVDWHLLPAKPDWSGGLAETWSPGAPGAEASLDRFVDTALGDYAEERDIPDVQGTSRLSPHLHFGEISPWRCQRRVSDVAHSGAGAAGVESFVRELAWREFSYHLLHHWPTLPEKAFRAQFDAFPWRDDEEGLRAWQQGKTGYPIVDAGMRELWHTGWMHNRVRMITASFLIKHLLIDWREWQWVAGSGADAAPYFRIYNPVRQGMRFDPEGRYVRRWVPELEDLPAKHVHAPWEADEGMLSSAGVRLGVSYPRPIVDHKLARNRALAAFKSLPTPTTQEAPTHA
jgi:deoxyribodipyrimidine photo-lyase